jgi:hypothetical protein
MNMPYQSGVNGPGERDCAARWEMIRGELAPGDGLKWFDGKCPGAQDGIEGELEEFGK